MRRFVTKAIEGPPVPPLGQAIPDSTLSYMLDEIVIGWSPEVRVFKPEESQFFLAVALDGGEHLLTTTRADHEECSPLVQRDPSARHLYFAVGVAYGKGGLVVKKGGDVCEGVGDHFVLLYIDVKAGKAILTDSLPSVAVTQYFLDTLLQLSTSIYGNGGQRVTLLQPPCKRQAPGSNDCAVHVWRNIADALTSHHPVPAFGDLLIDPDDVCRDVFRSIFYRFYF